MLASVLPWNIVHKVVSIHAGRAHSRHDNSIWGWSKCGNFSVKFSSFEVEVYMERKNPA